MKENARVGSLPERRHPEVASATLCLLCMGVGLGVGAATIPEHPLITSQAAVPMSMLVVGRDHTLFYEAYNDASDIDGDGTLDTRFKPSITYYGLFDSSLCYAHSGGASNSDLFTPGALAGELGRCSGSYPWSGNWLNYATTSRIDALRKVFYGGHRDVDTDSQTVLRRSFIPQDAHSWAKEYTSVAVDGYDISAYTPLSQPNTDRRHFFGNLTATAGVNCSTIDSCSNLPPLLRVVQNSDRRVWNWASTERPVLRANDHGGTSRTDYTVRAEVCTDDYFDGCKSYGESRKPIGLLHDYGESETMLFGLLTGSYDKNMSGGVLRRVVASFKHEVDPDTGQFTADATIVKALNSLRIRDFNNARTDNAYRGGWVATRPMNEAEFVDWANPMAEMMYEALRYYAGKKSPTADFATTGGFDAQIGLPVPTWDDPYESGSAASAPWCARPNLLAVSGINPSFDSDQVPGSYFGSFSGDLSDLDVSSLGQAIANGETAIKGLRFIGQSGSNYDGAPTAKDVQSLGNIRGLAPEEPTKQGSYYSASVAHFGKTNALRPGLQGNQTVDTYAVVLSSPLPRIEAPTASGRTITLVPFAKSVGGFSISNAKGGFQPTNQIVDFYVDTIDYASEENEGRYLARFRINFEDVEQGADHDMDAIVVYEITALEDGRLRVRLTPEYQAGSIQHSMGYVISGTNNDGVYLVVQDENVDRFYHLNVPPGMNPGDCDVGSPPAACTKLPYINGPLIPTDPPYTTNLRYSQRDFTPGDSSATLLKDPLWYAAKWGGFVDRNKNQKPDLAIEWDADNNGVPDTYFLVQNPLKLKEALKRSFDSIVERSASAGNITSNGQQIDGGSKVFQTRFNSASWDGDLFAYPVTSSGVSDTASWNASSKLPGEPDRTIFTRKDSENLGIAFAWENMTEAQQALLGTEDGEDVLAWLRGDQSKELQNGGIYRNRSKLLGDLVHSSPYFVKDTNTVYVGGNDGMLHAFDADSGTELFAYMPRLIFHKLASLASPSYTHTYYVDGDIAVSSKAQTPGKNYLAASTGRGAKGLFALDVTTPASFDGDDVLWEMDASGDGDLGFVLGRPQIGKLEDDTVAVIVGNGYNSADGKAVLFVLDLETGDLIGKIDTLAGGDNGMSTPTLWDGDDNGKIDTVYAGDLKGNVWRFDLSGGASSPGSWRSEFLLGDEPAPLFKAVDPTNPQHITAQVTVAKNTRTSDLLNYGKTYVFFGTGSYVLGSDPADKQVQTWYGLIDEAVAIPSRADLKVRTIDTQGTVGGTSVRVWSEATSGDMTGKKGWLVDLSFPSAQGERIVTRSNLYQFLEPVLIASSIIPDPDPCNAGGSGFVNAIDPFTGGRLGYAPFDLNDDGKFDADDNLDGKVVGSFGPDIGMPGEATLVGDRLVVGGSTGEIDDQRVNLGAKQLGRLSWREIIEE